jgi:hypothetical protein
MRWRVIAVISLCVNVLFLGVWGFSSRQKVPARALSLIGEAQAAPLIKTNVVLRRQFFSWQEVESPDYEKFIANLRDISCPEQTIRDIIIADVNSLYARKRANEVLTPEQQWWRSEPDSNVVAVANEKITALENERRGLLTHLLGPTWESGDLVSLPRPTRQGITLDGSVLGALPAETKQSIEDISLRSQDTLQAYLDSARAAGKEPDPAELAKIRQQTRAELEKILSPAQLEEYLLRYSQNANELRSELGQLQYFNATPDEFRAVFRATDPIEQRLQSLAGATDPASLEQRKSLEQQRQDAIKLALGPQRYAQYAAFHDPNFRDAYATAAQAGAPESAQIIYEINLATAEEQARIQANTNLSAEQRAVEMKQLELDQAKANAVVAGQDLPPDPSTTPPPPPKKMFVVGPGDTAATLSIRYGVPVSAFRAANPNVDLNHLRPGDSVVVPPNALNPVNIQGSLPLRQ